MEELPLSFTNVLGQCVVNSFYAGIIGNLAATGIQWTAIEGHSQLKDFLLKGTGSALKSHDLVRALVRAQLEAATQVIDITLLEDYSAETTATRNWITHLSYLFPGKALRDQSNDQIKGLWGLRAKLEERLKELGKLTATELDRNLVVAITNAQSIAAPEISAGVEGPYAEWSDAAAEAMCHVLANLAAPSDIPETLRTRILNGEWTDLFRVAFREELKRDENAETAYFINVHDTLATYANQHARELGDLKAKLEQSYNRQDGKLSELRNLLFSLRSHVKNLEAASDAERKAITTALKAEESNWRKVVNEQQQHWQHAHANHIAILMGQSKAAKRLVAIEGRIEKVQTALADALPKQTTAQQLHSESCALAEAGSFEQAAIKAEEACVLAVKEGDTRLQWRTSLMAARDWLNHRFDTSLSEPARENVVARAAKNIAVAENAGAPAGQVALEKALLAGQQHDIEGVIRYTTLVASDASCSEAYQAEALAMRLQALLFAERIDDAVACVEDVDRLRLSAGGEQRFQIEAAWLRILCAAQLATEDDVTHFIEFAERLTVVHPKLRFRTLNTVIHQFSRAAQEQAKPAAAKLIFERLTRLKRMTNDCVAQFARLLDAFGAHEQNKGAEDELKALHNELAELLNSARPQTGSRHNQGIRLLESGYSIMKPTDDALQMADIAAKIAEYSAEAGDKEKTELFLGYCDSWIEACKGGTNDGRRPEWCSLRARALLVRGKSFYRLGCRALESKTPAERWFVGAHEATSEARSFASEHRDQMHGNGELFLADASYWLAEIEVKLGRNSSAAKFFEQTRSNSAMANPRFLERVGMLAWFKEAEAHLYAGEIGRATKVVSALIGDPRTPEHVATQANDLKEYMEENIAPVVDWFSGANAVRIREMAKRHGLRAAISAQTKYLVDWHERFFSGSGPSLNKGLAAPSMREAYEFWGRGGFSRIVAAIRAKPNSAIAVDALTCEEIRRFARLLCPLFDTVVIKWKGVIEADLGIRGFPDPAPDGDEFGDFFGGMGFVRCMGDRKTNTTVLIGSSNLLPEEVGVFLATEALPLVRSGRLILLPAPLVGCTQTAIGWTDDMLTRHFLKGVMNVAASASGATRSDQQSIDVAQVAIPFIDGVSLPDLAHVLEDASDSLLPLRSLVFNSLSSNLAHERWAKINSVEGDFRDACRRLEEVLGALKPKSGDSNWSVKTLASSANAVAPGTSMIGSDANTDVLRAVCPIDKDLSPWIPFWRLEGLGGYLDWSCDLDNPSDSPTQTMFGPIRHSWIYPGTGGPGLAAGRMS